MVSDSILTSLARTLTGAALRARLSQAKFGTAAAKPGEPAWEESMDVLHREVLAALQAHAASPKPSRSGAKAAPGRVPEGADQEVGPLRECPSCKRSFAGGAYDKHAKVCAKVFQQKREVFDTSKQRQIAADKKGQQDAAKAGKALGERGQQPKWKNNSTALRKQLQQAKQASVGGDGSAAADIPIVQVSTRQQAVRSGE